MKLSRESSFEKDMQRTMIRIIELLKRNCKRKLRIKEEKKSGAKKKRNIIKWIIHPKARQLKLQYWLSLQHLTKLSSLILSCSSFSFSTDWNGAWKISNLKIKEKIKHFKYCDHRQNRCFVFENNKIVPSLGLTYTVTQTILYLFK